MKKNIKIVLITLAAALWSLIISAAVNYAMFKTVMTRDSFLGGCLGCLIAIIVILCVEWLLRRRKYK